MLWLGKRAKEMLEKFGVRVTPFMGGGGDSTNRGKVMGSKALELQARKKSQAGHVEGTSSAGKHISKTKGGA